MSLKFFMVLASFAGISAHAQIAPKQIEITEEGFSGDFGSEQHGPSMIYKLKKDGETFYFSDERFERLKPNIEFKGDWTIMHLAQSDLSDIFSYAKEHKLADKNAAYNDHLVANRETFSKSSEAKKVGDIKIGKDIYYLGKKINIAGKDCTGRIWTSTHVDPRNQNSAFPGCDATFFCNDFAVSVDSKPVPLKKESVDALKSLQYSVSCRFTAKSAEKCSDISINECVDRDGWGDITYPVSEKVKQDGNVDKALKAH